MPRLLELLSLRGCIVTADATNCLRAIAVKVVEQGGDYVLALKGNQPTLLENVQLHLDDPAQADKLRHARTVDADHGRIETRDAFVCDNVGWLCERHAWPGLRAIGKLARQREINRITTTETAWFLLSTPLSAERFAAVVRGHLGIENGLHWAPESP